MGEYYYYYYTYKRRERHGTKKVISRFGRVVVVLLIH